MKRKDNQTFRFQKCGEGWKMKKEQMNKQKNKMKVMMAMLAAAIMVSTVSPVGAVTAQAAVKKPAKVTVKSVSSPSAGKVTVKWKKAARAKGYQIMFATDKKYKKGKKVVKISSGKATSKSVSGLKQGKKYYVKVRAYTTSGKKKKYGSWSKSKTITVKKAVAKKKATASKSSATKKKVTATNSSSTKKSTSTSSSASNVSVDAPSFYSFGAEYTRLNVTVNAVKNASGYQLRYATNANMQNAKTVNFDSNRKKEVSGLSPNTTYYFDARAYRNVSGKTYYSAWSTKYSLKTQKVTYSNPTKNNNGTYHAPLSTTSKKFTINGGESVNFDTWNSCVTEDRNTCKIIAASTSNNLVLRSGTWWDYGYTVEGVSSGTATAKITLDNGSVYTFEITVTGTDDYYYPYDTWKKQWISENINSSMTTMEKVEKVMNMISKFSYYQGNSIPQSLYKYKKGNCLAGANMLADFCKDLSIPAEARFAGDDLEKYNINYGQTEGHSNCFVWIDGKKYLCDSTPGYSIMIWPWDYD